MRAAEEGRLKGAEIFLFTDKQAAEGAYYRSTSPSWALFELVVTFYKLQMKYDLVLIWIAGTRMIHQGTDGLSPGEEMGPANQGLSLVGVVPLHLGVLEQSPQVLEWIHSWTGVLQREVLSPEGWYTDGHKQVNFLWAPPPAAADAAVEQLCKAVHKRLQCTHLFMMNWWRKKMLKATDLKFFLKAECQVWDSSIHEPLGFFIYLPLCRHEPWRMRYTATVVELESDLRSLPCDDLLQKGNLLCKFLVQTRKLDTMPESVVRKLLQGPGGEQVPYKIAEELGWKRAL
jgi:hypothetical protein